VFCRAELNYASREGALAGCPVTVDVRDGRRSDLPGWRDCGFELLDHPSTVRDWTDDEELATVHYAEVEALARVATGCDAALVSDHVRRSAEPVRRPRDQVPVRLVHSDFAADYEHVIRPAYHDVKGRGAATLRRAGVTADQIEQAARIVMLQFWRNVAEPKMDFPMAFCDARTVTPAETRPFHYTGYVAGGRSFDALAVLAPDRPDRHGWYTFPEMTADEVVLFRTYDTGLVGRGETWFTPHSSFRDPEVEAGRPARVSVELRVLCVYLSP
jgi:hypothetical protein